MSPRPDSATREPWAWMKPSSQTGAYIALSCTSCWIRCRIASRRFRSSSPACSSEEPVDVGIASVDVDAARGYEGLEAGRRVPEGAADAVDEVLQLLLLVPLEEGCPLERPDPRPDPHSLQVAHQRLTHGGGCGIAPEVSGVEASRIAGLGEELLGLGGIVGVRGRLPEEIEALRDDAPGDPRESEGQRLVDGLRSIAWLAARRTRRAAHGDFGSH